MAGDDDVLRIKMEEALRGKVPPIREEALEYGLQFPHPLKLVT